MPLSPALRQILLMPSPSGHSVEAQQYYDRLLTPPSPRDEVLLGNLIDALVACRAWLKRDAYCLFAAADPDAGLTNLKSANFKATLNTEVGLATFTPYRGFTLAGGAYIASNFVPSTANGHLTRDDAGVAGWNLSTTGNSALIDTNNQVTLWPISNGDVSWNVTGGSIINTFNAADASGWWLAQRTGPNALELFRDDITLGSGNSASIALTSDPIIYRHFYEHAAAAIGGSLTPLERAGEYTAFRVYLQAVGTVP